MKRHLLIFVAQSAIGLLTMGVVSTTWAECILPAVTPSGADGLVTKFDGNMSCDSITGQFGCVIPDGEGSCTADNGSVFFDVSSTIDPNTGEANWSVESGAETNRLKGIDSIISDAAQGGNGCLYAFQADATQGKAGFMKSNGNVVLRNLSVCADIQDEPPPPPPPPPVEPIAACEILSGGTANLAGVGITCPTGPAGYNQKTVIVATDTDYNGNPVPDKGFRDPVTNEITFSRFLCVCNNSTGGDEDQCNPNLEINDTPEVTGDYIGLEACVTASDTDSSDIIDFSNPTCVTSGGRRRCY